LIVPLHDSRQQEVAATIRTTPDGREVIDFVSTVGHVLPGLDPWQLLEANGQSVFSRVTVSRQLIFVLASQLLATAQPEEVLLILREVATFADQLERKLFHADTF
jgi:inactivated superfamily I helicase